LQVFSVGCNLAFSPIKITLFFIAIFLPYTVVAQQADCAMDTYQKTLDIVFSQATAGKRVATVKILRSFQPEWAIVFDATQAWDSIDMAEALHPQTLVSYGMNGGELPVPFGGPLRMRVPRQLGYKNVKYITRLTITDNLKHFGKGLGSGTLGAEDGYAWYAGI
jgi:Oxidoreductase molybdopterin binding domain